MDPRDFSISELKDILKESRGRVLSDLIKTLSEDPRAGARKLSERAQAEIDWNRRETTRLRQMMEHERRLLKAGHKLIAGVDEVGRGALAGPVVAAAVILRPDETIYGVNDSKKLARDKRAELFGTIKERAVAWAVAEVWQNEIDQMGIQRANLIVLEQAVLALKPRPELVISDRFKINCPGTICLPLVRADSISQTVAAASIVAKVHRDGIMEARHEKYPAYGFVENKGYGTSNHIDVLKEIGPCELHRRSFFPMNEGQGRQLSLDMTE